MDPPTPPSAALDGSPAAAAAAAAPAARPCFGSCLGQCACGGYVRTAPCPVLDECQPVPCPNVQFCGFSGPAWYLAAHGGLCLDCNMAFGVSFVFRDDESCPVCLKSEGDVDANGNAMGKVRVALLDKCGHPLCLGCLAIYAGMGPSKPTPARVCNAEESAAHEAAAKAAEEEEKDDEDDDDDDDDDDGDGDGERARAAFNAGKCPLCRGSIAPPWRK
jgi:hypothetical protein